MRKIAALLLASLLLMATLTACGSPSSTTKSDDMVAILTLLAGEIPAHRLTNDAEDGRIIVIDVSSFNADDIKDFIDWAEEEFQHPPDLFAIVTSDNPEPITTEKVYQLYGGAPSDTMLQEWTYFTYTLEKYSTFLTTRAVVNVDVTFPNGDLVGAGYAVSLEKQEGVWVDTGSETLWVS